MRIFRVLFLWLLPFIACTPNQDDQRVYRVKRGPFRAIITETGELQAVKSKMITMPHFNYEYGRPKIIGLEKEGIVVKKGDFVCQLDTASIVRVLKNKEADLAIAQADLRKMKVENESKMKELDSELISAQSTFREAQIDTQRTKFESPSQQEISILRLKIAEINLRTNQAKIEHTQKIQEEDIRIQREKINQINSAIKDAIRTINRFNIRAPDVGMIEYRRRGRDREKIRIGEELYPGAPILGLPDLSRMKVETTINETDIDTVYAGEKVLVRLDAFPRIDFTGVITRISRTCRSKDRDSQIKVFDVEVLLDEAESILKPGMTVSCEIIVAEYENVLYVDNLCICRDGGEYYVYVDFGSELQKVEVILGPRNNKNVMVSGNLKEGDKIIAVKKREDT